MRPSSSTPKSSKTSNESAIDDGVEGGRRGGGGGEVSEQCRDAAVMRIFLSTKLDMLKSRELSYQRQQQQKPPVSVGEAHADCLLLTSTDVDCDSLRAAYATGAILAADISGGGKPRLPDEVDDEAERQRQRKLLRETTGDLWLDYCLTVTRLYYRIEAAFLRMATPIVTAAGVDNATADAAVSDAVADAVADRQSQARQLWLLVDAIAGLATRLGVELRPEFESCRECLQRCLTEEPRKRDKSLTSSQRLTSKTSKWSTAASTPSPVASSANQKTTDSQQRQSRQQMQQSQEPVQVSSLVLLPWRKCRRRSVLLLFVALLSCLALLPFGWYLRSLGIFCLDWDLILDRLVWPNGIPY